ncbi:PrpF domain-containing protein [Niallia sp. 03133]|uniref:PrpF domain-containing protein n=1 Tax=Niallia sp. 03133 TaxID=3458060 RepID=UPI004044049B
MKNVSIAFFYGEGGPSPTVVISEDALFDNSIKLHETLHDVMDFVYKNWRALHLSCCPTKIALIRPSKHNDCDLDYLFIQVMIKKEDSIKFKFDSSGNCGHSLVAAIAKAMWQSLITPSEIQQKLTVFMVNTNIKTSFEVDTSEIKYGKINCSIEYCVSYDEKLLPTGKSTQILDVLGRSLPVSIINAGNPYVLVHASQFGIKDEESLFLNQDHLIPDLLELRREVGKKLGFPITSVFPKIALVIEKYGSEGQFEGIAARALYIDKWHPGLGITGLVCLGTAINTPNSILYHSANQPENTLKIRHSTGTVPINTRNRNNYCFVKINNKKAKMVLPLLSIEG